MIFTGSPVAFNGGIYYVATSSITNLSIPQNQQIVLTIKADVNQIGTGQAGTSGHEIKIGLAQAQGVGNSSGSSVYSGVGTAPTTGIAIFRSTPTVSLVSLPSSGISADGQLVAFSVSANSNNPVGIGQLKFTVTPGANVTVTNPALYAYTSYSSGSFSGSAGGTNNGLVTKDGTNSAVDPGVITSTTATTTKMGTPIEIPAGTTVYFVLKASTVTYSGANSTWSVGTTLAADGTDLAPNLSTVAGLSSNNFVWSPNSTTTSPTTYTDWTNGFGAVPSVGLSQSRNN